MKAVGGGKVVFGFTGMYAFAGSHEDYFDKMAYRCIALAPLVLWSVLLWLISHAAPAGWFWVVWFIQAGNIGGAAWKIGNIHWIDKGGNAMLTEEMLKAIGKKPYHLQR